MVEGDLSKLIDGLSSRPGFVGVWDLISVIAPSQDMPGRLPQSLKSVLTSLGHQTSSADNAFGFSSGATISGDSHSLPAPSVEAVFTSPEYALLAFRFLGMDNGTSTFRMDPVFFEKYPELYDAQSSIMAKGTPIRPSQKQKMPMPAPMTTSLLQSYHDLAMWVVDIALEKMPQ